MNSFVSDLGTPGRIAKQVVDSQIHQLKPCNWMPLDRCPHVLQSTSPHPTQSSLHRGLQDRGIG